jgi:DNA-directed RNA polymerase specialized sigma24 family protein
MPYIRYSAAQKQFLKQHYHTLSAAELAHHLGTTPGKVYALARRLAVKWRAENGAPQWRPSKA